MAVYARILSLHPGKNLFEILIAVFGPLAGRLLALLFTWYAFHLGALVMRNFQEFIRIVSFPETPEFVPTMLMGILCIWAAREGAAVLGSWSRLMFPILAGLILTVTALSMKDASFDEIRPVAYNGMKPIFSSAFGVLTFPYAETVLFMAIFRKDRGKTKPLAIYLLGLVLSSVLIVIVSVRNVMVLGPDIVESLYFPQYAAVGIINIGDFLLPD